MFSNRSNNVVKTIRAFSNNSSTATCQLNFQLLLFLHLRYQGSRGIWRKILIIITTSRPTIISSPQAKSRRQEN